MSVIDTLRSVWAASTQSPDRGDGTGEPSGAYWCHDCEERTPARDVPDDSVPACPSCGEEMEFERSATTTGCAC